MEIRAKVLVAAVPLLGLLSLAAPAAKAQTQTFFSIVLNSFTNSGGDGAFALRRPDHGCVGQPLRHYPRGL